MQVYPSRCPPRADRAVEGPFIVSSPRWRRRVGGKHPVGRRRNRRRSRKLGTGPQDPRQRLVIYLLLLQQRLRQAILLLARTGQQLLRRLVVFVEQTGDVLVDTGSGCLAVVPAL